MPESWNTRLRRWRFNWFPAYYATGGRITYIAADWREVRVRLRLTWLTRNYVGTLFGGSLYGAIDPIYMIMLIHVLGAHYEVWDKAATIRFRRPGRSTLRATFRLEEAALDAIRQSLALHGKAEYTFTVELTTDTGEVSASFEKVLSIREREARADEPSREQLAITIGANPPGQ